MSIHAFPRIVFNGIRDRSRRPFIRPEITFAQHTPLLRLFTETGPTETTYVGDTGDSFASIFGATSLDQRSKYFNLQSLLALNLLGEGNGFFVKRLRPEDAGNNARVTIGIEIVRDEIPETLNQLAGFNYPGQVDDTGNNPVPDPDRTIDGYRVKVVMIEDNQSEIGTQRALPGTMVSSVDGTVSTVYPLFEMESSFFGKLGDSLGMRIWAPTTIDPEGLDDITSNRFKTRLYRMQFVERNEGSSNPTIIKTKFEEDYVDVSFDEGVYSEEFDRDLTIDEVLLDQYEDDGVESGLSPLFSPFANLHVYRDNIELVQNILFEAENRINPAIAAHVSEPTQMDFLTMLGEDGDPYQSVLVEGPIEGGLLLGKHSTIYAVGGNDGTTSWDEYVKLVDLENTNFGKLNDVYEDKAKWPFGILYDTGLPMASKYKAMQVLGARQDLQYFFTTYVETDRKPLSASEEVSRVQALMTRIKAYPESVLYGTGVCRAMIIAQSGKVIGGGFNKQVPQLMDVAIKWARYAGAGTGILRQGFEMDASPNNEVSTLKRLNVGYFNVRSQANLWANGATYSTSLDTRTNYYPCLRSVYQDDTSVLLSPITVNICCVIMRLIHRVHASYSGNAAITKEQLVERCDQEIIDRTKELFGERVVITPNTVITALDENNGSSWTCNVTVEANNPRTTLYFNLETVRMGDANVQQ